MPYRPLPLKPTQGQPWRDFGDATYDNVAQFVTDLPALEADVAAAAAQAATLTATKAPLNSPTFTGTVSGVTRAHVGLGNVDNTAGQWVINILPIDIYSREPTCGLDTVLRSPMTNPQNSDRVT